MDALLRAKDELSTIQEQLIEYLTVGEESQDLTHLFAQLRVENPIAYELSLLMYQDFKTKSKIDRKKMAKVITAIIKQNHTTYDKLIQHEQKLIIEKEKTMFEKLTNPKVLGTIVAAWLVVVLTLTAIYKVSPDAFHTIVYSMNLTVGNISKTNQTPTQTSQTSQPSTQPTPSNENNISKSN